MHTLMHPSHWMMSTSNVVHSLGMHQEPKSIIADTLLTSSMNTTQCKMKKIKRQRNENSYSTNLILLDNALPHLPILASSQLHTSLPASQKNPSSVIMHMVLTLINTASQNSILEVLAPCIFVPEPSINTMDESAVVSIGCHFYLFIILLP